MQGWSEGIKTAGGEVCAGANTPPPVPLNSEQQRGKVCSLMKAPRGLEVWDRGARSAARRTSPDASPTVPNLKTMTNIALSFS